jgi:hypothetical protein
MLSEEDYQNTLWRYDHIDDSITGQLRQNLRAALLKELHEHMNSLQNIHDLNRYLINKFLLIQQFMN